MHKRSTPKSKRAQTILIYRADGKVVGEVRNGVFQKHVRGSIHFLREPRSIAFDVSTLRDAERAGADRILVIDAETNIEYRTTIRYFRCKSFDVRRGHGEQVAMRLTEFNKPDDLDQTPLTTPKPSQPSLFDLLSALQ